MAKSQTINILVLSFLASKAKWNSWPYNIFWEAYIHKCTHLTNIYWMPTVYQAQKYNSEQDRPFLGSYVFLHFLPKNDTEGG